MIPDINVLRWSLKVSSNYSWKSCKRMWFHNSRIRDVRWMWNI